MNNPAFDDLLDKYLRETITPEETAQFFALLENPANQVTLEEYIGRDLEAGSFRQTIQDPLLIGRIKERLLTRREKEAARRLPHYSRKLLAAAVFFAITIGVWLWNKNKTSHPSFAKDQPAGMKNDLPPGREGAILTLGDGTRINLDSAGNGDLNRQGNTRLVKTNGSLAYDPPKGKEGQVVYNTITTPSAHQFRIVLADGTRVWLNALSSLRYPSIFTDGDRVVELKGEGYFEVTRNVAHPFKVRTGNTEIQDMGTQFNVMNYPDEKALKTTLVEGSVKVVTGRGSILLQPGEQAVTTGQEIEIRHDADVEEAIAWKNGLFLLKGEDVATTMRQIGRWYDVEIVYEGAIPKGHVVGDIPRAMNLSNVIELFRQFDISCELKGKKLIVAAP